MAPLYAPVAQKPSAQPNRQLSAISESSKNGVFLSSMIRAQLTFSTWMLLGATLQSLLFLLPIQPFYTLLPALIILLYRLVTDIFMAKGYIENTYMNDVIQGKYTAVFPSLHPDTNTKSTPEEENQEVCIFLLTARNNHPLSLLAPRWKEFVDTLPPMIASLEANAATNGFLGGSTWLSSSDRLTQNELMLTMYFRSPHDIHAFAHSDVHRVGWNWYNDWLKTTKTRHIAISHEIFHAKKGGWETIYANMAPNSFARTSIPVTMPDGDVAWDSPIVDASVGKYRTTKGRMGESDGTENEKYGEA